MNELKGKFVNLVLSIDEGRGFDLVKSQMYISASFNGRTMESDPVESRSNVVFNTEIVWETEKKLLRKARGSYQRVRVECYTMEKKCIGFCLLCLRSAQILPASRSNLEVPYTWMKLMSIPNEFKKGLIELNVSLTIRDHVASDIIPPAIPQFTIPGPFCGGDKIVIPVKNVDDGYIQVGNDDELLEKFHFEINLHTANNLDILLPESFVFTGGYKKLQLALTIFGVTVKTKKPLRSFHENLKLNERIVMKILSNFKNLSMYVLQFPTVPISVINGDINFGNAYIDLTQMGWDGGDDGFYKWKDGKMEAIEDIYFEMPGSGYDRKPYLNVQTVIELVKEYGAFGDSVASSHSEHAKKVQAEISKVTLDSISSPALCCDDAPRALDQHKQFCLDIILDSIIWKQPLRNLCKIIKFKHPKCHNVLQLTTNIEKVVNTRIILDNVICKIIYICAKGRIINLLKSYVPTVLFIDSKGIEVCKEVTLDCSKLNLSKLESSEVMSLRNSKNDEVAILNVSLFLEICDTKPLIKSNFELRPLILDDNILINDLNALNKWKDKEMENYKTELEELRKKELEVLHADWVARKTKLQNELVHNLNRCKELSKKLKKQAHNVALDAVLQNRKEQDGEFNLFMEIHKNTVKYSLCENHELIETISRLERDIATLRDLLCEQNLDLQTLRKSVLTSDQTKNLIQDLKNMEQKYEEAIKDKNYFKSEWENALQEVHNLRMEKHKNLRSKLAIEKEQLSQLSLDSFFSAL